MNKEIGSTYLCNSSVTQTVGEGVKAVMGGCTGVVIKESHFVLPELEWCADDGCHDDERVMLDGGRLDQGHLS